MLPANLEDSELGRELTAANQHRQELVLELDAAEAQIVSQAEELIVLRQELEDARLQLALERTTRAVTGESYSELNEMLDDDTVVIDDPDATKERDMHNINDAELALYAAGADDSVTTRMARELVRMRGAGQPASRPGFDVVDLNRIQIGNLVAYLGHLQRQRAEVTDKFAAQAIDVRIAEVQRELAISNARGTAALGDFQQLPPSIRPALLEPELLRRTGLVYDGAEGSDAAVIRKLLGHIACLVAVQRQAIADACAQVASASARELERQRPSVCSSCNDTHVMALGERDLMCTRCPTPCEACRGRTMFGVPTAYCASTPCSCSCHASKEVDRG